MHIQKVNMNNTGLHRANAMDGFKIIYLFLFVVIFVSLMLS